MTEEYELSTLVFEIFKYLSVDARTNFRRKYKIQVLATNN